MNSVAAAAALPCSKSVNCLQDLLPFTVGIINSKEIKKHFDGGESTEKFCREKKNGMYVD